MIRFEFCTATTICVDIKEQAHLQASWEVRSLDTFLDREPQVVIFKDGQDIVGVADEEQVVRGEMCTDWFMLSPTMFQEARDAFHDKLAPGMHVFVLNDEQRVVGIVRYEKNYLDKGWQDPQDYWDYDFQHELVNEDLLNKADVYLFLSLEEYSYAIVRYLGEQHPERTIYFWDPDKKWRKLTELWQGISVHFLAHWGEFYERRKWMVIGSKMQRSRAWTQDFIHLNYCSLQVMYSMLWGTHPVHLGPIHPDKKIALIDLPQFNPAGLIDLSINLCACATYLERKGFVPVIDLSTPHCCNFWEEGLNVWEELFHPWSDSGITVEEARRSSNVIRTSLEMFWWSGTMHWSPYHTENYYYSNLAQYNRDKLHLNDKTWNYVLDHVPQALRPRLEARAYEETEGRVGKIREEREKKRILGVKLRGTDYNLWPSGGASIETMVDWCRSLWMTGIYDSMYLATEDRSYFERFQKEFPGKLLFIEQPRVVGGKNVADHLAEYGHEIDLARLYLADIKCLAVCDDLITNRDSGAYFQSMLWRRQTTGFCKVIKEYDPAPVSLRMARIYLRTNSETHSPMQMEVMDSADSFLVRNVKEDDGRSGKEIAPNGHIGCVHLRVRLEQETTLEVELSSAAAFPDGHVANQWVTFTSLAVNGEEQMGEPVHVCAGKSQKYTFLVSGWKGFDLCICWKAYPYTGEEMSSLLRQLLPRNRAIQRPAIPVPPIR